MHRSDSESDRASQSRKPPIFGPGAFLMRSTRKTRSKAERLRTGTRRHTSTACATAPGALGRTSGAPSGLRRRGGAPAGGTGRNDGGALPGCVWTSRDVVKKGGCRTVAFGALRAPPGAERKARRGRREEGGRVAAPGRFGMRFGPYENFLGFLISDS